MWSSVISANLVEIVCSVITTLAVAALMWAIKQLKKSVHHIQILFDAVRADNGDKIIRYGNFYILSGQITVDEIECLTALFEPYKALGGNGTAKNVYERCLKLPIVAERTKWNPYYVNRDG